MHPELEAKLKLRPEDLFNQGACHIFAREFVKTFPKAGLQIRRAGRCKLTFTEASKGLHVYAYKDDWLFDVSGKHIEEKYLLASSWGYWDSSEQELFTPFQSDDKGPLNRWRHFLDESFVEAASSIARNYIRSCESIWFPNGIT